MFIPRKSIYATKSCEEKHKEVGHIGAKITMAKVKGKYWVPRPKYTNESIDKV